MKRLALAFALTALAGTGLAACNNDDLPPAQQYATVQGTIVDSATKQPVAGATITVDTILTATTDANGKFKIDRVPVGIFDYTIAAQGHKVAQASTTAEPGKPLELDVALDPDSSVKAAATPPPLDDVQ
ncbi:MAG: carboxypeptidase regulatory-like domain-containing protein [Vulcanimicrobiaceae bacterium]